MSKWLFVGQLAASFGFTVYSFLLENRVFVFANFFLFLTALVGQWIYMRNKRLVKRRQRLHEEKEGRVASR